jgi:hypothetical protein
MEMVSSFEVVAPSLLVVVDLYFTNIAIDTLIDHPSKQHDRNNESYYFFTDSAVVFGRGIEFHDHC